MNERESDPTGAFSRDGAAGLENETNPRPQVESTNADVDDTERETITSGTAATSEVADREAQDDAERQGDGTPQPR